MKKINLEKLLLVYIIILPVLDITSFLFRNYFNTNLSISTILRPVIPITAIIIIFFKNKFKLKTIIIGLIYGIYALMHLYVFYKIKTQISYGVITHEMQYLVNYTFSILNLFIFMFVFYKKDTNKITKSILIANAIYILSIYISIITKTSSTTYIEGIGFKGWFESGNSISSILILNLFIIFTLFNKSENKKIKVISIIEIILSGIFLSLFLGTRTGLYGLVMVSSIFVFAKIFIVIRDMFLKNKESKMSKKNTIILFIVFALVIAISILVILNGNSILKRRKYLESIEDNIYDSKTGQTSHVSGDILKIKESIENEEVDEKYISKQAQKSILDLYNYANKNGISNTDRRTQQLVYNAYLVKNQSNMIYVVFGNGFLTNFGELTLEMEIPAFLFNFGLIGFILYFMPFFTLFLYYLYIGIRNVKILNEQFIILLCGIFMSFILSLLLGKIFFNSSAIIIITVMNVLLFNKCIQMKSKKT